MKEQLKQKFFNNQYLYILPILCSFLFFWKIGNPSYWFDELSTVNIISPDNTKNFFSNYFQNEMHPPLYYLFLKSYFVALDTLVEISKHLIITIYSVLDKITFLNLIFQTFEIKSESINLLYFKFNFLNSMSNLNESSVRLISALSLTAVNIYIFNFFKNNKLIFIGLAICALIGTNQNIINHAQEARPYGLFSFIFILVAKNFYDSYKSEFTFTNFKKLIILNTLLLLTHYYAIFVIFAEISILAAVNRKHTRLVMWSVLLIVLSYVVYPLIYDKFYFSEMSFITKNKSAVLLDTYKYSFNFIIAQYFSLIMAILFCIKIYFKGIAHTDKILIKVFVFLNLIIGFIYLAQIIRPIFYFRYTVFLIPLPIIMFCCVAYSAGSLFFTNNLKWNTFFANLFLLIFSSRIVIANQELIFSPNGYFTRQKYYPMRNAYEKIVNDSDYRPQAAYIIEESLPVYFKTYEKKYQLRPILSIDPKLSNAEKKQMINNKLITPQEKTIYYLRVNRDLPEIEKQQPLELDGYKKTIIFVKEKIQIFKFLKKD